MRNILITQPVASVGDNSEAAVTYVAEHNAKILLRSDFPTCTEFFTPRMLLSDPNVCFSEVIAEMLHIKGLLSRVAHLNDKGQQEVIILDAKKSPLWNYSWEHDDFSVLDEAELLRVGWDLRRAPGFFNCMIFQEEEVLPVVEDVDNGEEDPHAEDCLLFTNPLKGECDCRGDSSWSARLEAGWREEDQEEQDLLDAASVAAS